MSVVLGALVALGMRLYVFTFFLCSLVCVFAYIHTRLYALVHALVCMVAFACMRVLHGICRCLSVLPSYVALSRAKRGEGRREKEEQG